MSLQMEEDTKKQFLTWRDWKHLFTKKKDIKNIKKTSLQMKDTKKAISYGKILKRLLTNKIIQWTFNIFFQPRRKSRAWLLKILSYNTKNTHTHEIANSAPDSQGDKNKRKKERKKTTFQAERQCKRYSFCPIITKFG